MSPAYCSWVLCSAQATLQKGLAEGLEGGVFTPGPRGIKGFRQAQKMLWRSGGLPAHKT